MCTPSGPPVIHETIKPLPLGLVLADRLRSDILRGVLRSGQILVQSDLAEHFGTSRIPIREAIQQLEREGLVVVQANRRCIVAAFDEEDLRDHYRVRALIEREAAARCALQGADLRELELIQRRIDRGSANDGPDVGHESLVRDFHHWIWLQSGSKQLKLIAESLWTGQGSYTPSPIPNQVQRSTHDHHAIIAAIKAGDSSAARALMEEHILNSGEALLIYRNANSEKGDRK